MSNFIAMDMVAISIKDKAMVATIIDIINYSFLNSCYSACYSSHPYYFD